MEDTDMKELIGNFSAMIEELKSKQDEIESKLNEVLDGANSAYADWDHNKKKSAFSERNKDFLDKYSDKLKKIEGDDFDLAEEAMSGVGDADEAEYIAALAASIDEQLDSLREALGVSEVKTVDTPEETEIEADGEEVAEVSENSEDDDGEEAETEDSEEELEAFRKQIAEEKAKARR